MNTPESRVQAPAAHTVLLSFPASFPACPGHPSSSGPCVPRRAPAHLAAAGEHPRPHIQGHVCRRVCDKCDSDHAGARREHRGPFRAADAPGIRSASNLRGAGLLAGGRLLWPHQPPALLPADPRRPARKGPGTFSPLPLLLSSRGPPEWLPDPTVHQSSFVSLETRGPGRQPTKWEEVFANDMTNKGLIPNRYKQLAHLNIKKHTTSFKNGQKKFPL